MLENSRYNMRMWNSTSSSICLYVLLWGMFMWKYLVRLFTYFKEESLGLKRCEIEHYPFHSSLKEYIPKAYSPLFAIKFARDISESLNVTMTQVEIILFLISEPSAIEFEDIVENIDHVSEDHIKRSLNEMIQMGLVYRLDYSGNDLRYGAMLELREDIGSYYKD